VITIYVLMAVFAICLVYLFLTEPSRLERELKQAKAWEEAGVKVCSQRQKQAKRLRSRRHC